jgi:Sec-independent protein translocase protein TatA
MNIWAMSLLLILVIAVLLAKPEKLGLALREFRRGLEGRESSLQPGKKEPE